MISARSVPRIQAVIGNASMRTFSKPNDFSFFADHSAAARSAGDPAGRGPMRVVSSLAKSHATDSPRIALSRRSLAMLSDERSAACAPAVMASTNNEERMHDERFIVSAGLLTQNDVLIVFHRSPHSVDACDTR